MEGASCIVARGSVAHQSLLKNPRGRTIIDKGLPLLCAKKKGEESLLLQADEINGIQEDTIDKIRKVFLLPNIQNLDILLEDYPNSLSPMWTDQVYQIITQIEGNKEAYQEETSEDLIKIFCLDMQETIKQRLAIGWYENLIQLQSGISTMQRKNPHENLSHKIKRFYLCNQNAILVGSTAVFMAAFYTFNNIW